MCWPNAYSKEAALDYEPSVCSLEPEAMMAHLELDSLG